MIQESIFVGNIMQRTWCETEVVGPDIVSGETYCWTLKENATLYRTANGLYVDLDNIKKKSDFKKVNKIINDETRVGSFETKNGIQIMCGIPLSEVDKIPTAYGVFVDSESLIDYQNLQSITILPNIKGMKKGKISRFN